MAVFNLILHFRLFPSTVAAGSILFDISLMVDETSFGDLDEISQTLQTLIASEQGTVSAWHIPLFFSHSLPPNPISPSAPKRALFFYPSTPCLPSYMAAPPLSLSPSSPFRYFPPSFPASRLLPSRAVMNLQYVPSNHSHVDTCFFPLQCIQCICIFADEGEISES